MKNMRKGNAGFTLTEVIVVITIIGILAAVAIPSMTGFIEHGKQVNRMNIARTLYLAVQNQLTKSSVEKNLKSTLAGAYFKKDNNNEYYTDFVDNYQINIRNVSQTLTDNGGVFPSEEAANEAYIHYISKPQNYTPPTDAEIDGMTTEADQNKAKELRNFYNLLDEIIIDKTILNDAILIEYNIKTGVVLSLFYGDAFVDGQTEFEYKAESNDDRNNVTGGRGVDSGYKYASQRKQGYYGVEATGAVPPVIFKDIINVYDGADKPLAIGFGENKVNVLYVELLLAKQYKADGITEDAMPAYTIEIVNAQTADNIVSISVDNLDGPGFPSNFNAALNRAFSDEAIYHDTLNPFAIEQYGLDVSGNYNRYIWVIDYIADDLLGSQPHSIDSRLTEPQNICAKASKGSGAGVTSLTRANTHFAREMSAGQYEIKSARHLNNVRYKPDGRYRQTTDIDMQLAGNAVTNFAPIEAFSGKYYAMKTASTQYRILNLKINSQQSNVGLFANVSGSSIQGISLYKAVINAANSDNVGAIAGTMTGGTIKQCNSYANIVVSSNKTTNVGGLVGRISSGTLDRSINAGFYNAAVQSATSAGFGSVTANRGNIGGLVGLNYGTIQNSINNVRVNVDDVSVTKDGEKHSFDPVFTQLSAIASVGGIIGYNNGGTIQNTYATNFVSLVTDFGTTYGGIAGTNTGSYKLEKNFFLANGCSSSTGSEAVSKKQMRENPCGAAFASVSAAGNGNLYKNYPYPVLKNNNPFSDAAYDWVKYTCGWENIEDVKVSDTGLLYYELYNDGTTGFSGGGFASLVSSGSSKLVVNDGYVLDIGDQTATMEVTIGTATYVLTVISSSTPSCTWKDSGGMVIAGTSSMVAYPDGDGNQRLLLFFDNGFLESCANGEAYIDFAVKALNNTIISTRFNPLFANTVGRTVDNFSVRSPRHFGNINQALSTDYSQGLNLDFKKYHKTAAYTYQDGEKTVSGTTDNAAVVKISSVDASFTGEYDGNHFYIEAGERDKGLFAEIGSAGAVKRLVLQNSTIGQYETVGGIAAVNDGIIDSCTVSGVNVGGTSDIGIVTGVNHGSIVNTHVGNSTITNNRYDRTGGITGTNNGNITNCSVASSAIAGAYDYVGGIAGKNEATVANCVITSVTVRNTVAGNNIGGIVGENTSTGTITGCSVTSSTISGIHDNVGGVAGSNAGSVLQSGASYTAVSSSDGNKAGGIVGTNDVDGNVEDVFFLSTEGLDTVPVSAKSDDEVGGIAGANSGIVSRSLYLAPAPSKTTSSGTEIYPIVGSGTDAEITEFDTCYYLAGYRYSLNQGKNWIFTDYNRVYNKAGSKVILSGGGMGVVTKFIDREWLSYAYDVDLANWYQPTNGYPYPLPNGISAPTKWPETASPTRPEQEDRADSEWAEIESTSNRGRNVTFINGDFAVGSFTVSDCFEIVANITNGYRIFIDMSKVSGWSTRPVGSGNTSQPARNYLMELQEPIGTSGINSENYNNYMAGNYQGRYNTSLNILTSPYRYAELNADVQGTLYQVCTTTPGAQFYYSFHHATRHASSATTVITDQMNFYLTGVGDNDNCADDGALTLIRPCWSPRQRIATTYNTIAKTGTAWEKTSLRWNPAVRNTVKYDTLGSGSTQIKASDLSYYAGKFVGSWPSDNTRIYLYDVWIGNTTSSTSQTSTDGYGITFWSTSNRTLAATGYTTLDKLRSAAPEAMANVIGYWGISYGWKHYYGLYKVPAGQTRTEFAYQSRTANPGYGNYLDGISFKSPAFLSIDKYIKDGFDEDANFVTLDDTLTVELNVTSYGEIMADNIEITDKLAPYDEYIDYIGNVTVKKGTTSITGYTITPPAANNDQTLTVKLPASTTLAAGETLTVTFQIKVRPKVKSVEIETLLFYFKNQAEVHYNEDKQANRNYFTGYINTIKTNASETLQVYIDPIKLSKTVTPSKDGPFTVTLTVADSLGTNSSITTKGLITDLIPAGFSIVNKPPGAILTYNADGSTRLIIQNVNLGTVKQMQYTYTMTYTGKGYGVSYTSLSADYKYQYIDENYSLSVMLEFPRNIVGISVKTEDDVFLVDGNSAAQRLNIVGNDNFAEAMADANYDVTPEVVLLTGKFGTDTYNAYINGAGNYQIETPQYTAVLIKGSNRLEFTPKADANGSYELYYQIKLNAAKTGNASFELSSQVTKVTVNIVGNTLVYYEKYNDDAYGFYAASESVPSQLDDSKIIVESGYGVLSAASGRLVQLGSGTVSGLAENYNGMYLYKLATAPVTNLDLLTVKFGLAENLSEIGKIHPNFAKAVYSATAQDAGAAFYIRIPQQMRNIGLVDATGNLFIQERDLNFDNIDLNVDGAAVKGDFKGKYDGNGFAITNVTIDALSVDHVGLFSQNRGTICRVVLKPDTSIKGRDNVGGIAGYNHDSGTIAECVVAGDPVSFGGMHIEGNINVDAIAGLNEGEIINCTVQNTSPAKIP